MTILLMLLLFITAPAFADKGSSIGFIQKTYEVIASPFVAIKGHLEGNGKGQQAIQDLSKNHEIITGQQAIIQELIADKSASCDVLEKVAHGNMKLAKAQERRNDILGGVAQVGQVVGVVYSAVYIVRSGYDVGHWIYRYFRPTEETILRKKIVEQKLKSWYSKVALNRCLGRHLGTEKNAQGMLVRCEDEALLFVEMAGIKEYKEILEVLKD